jgi:hypothetical protein
LRHSWFFDPGFRLCRAKMVGLRHRAKRLL